MSDTVTIPAVMWKNALVKLDQLQAELKDHKAVQAKMLLAGDDILDSAYFEDGASERRARRAWEAATKTLR